jgi:hypothetical protein
MELNNQTTAIVILACGDIADDFNGRLNEDLILPAINKSNRFGYYVIAPHVISFNLAMSGLSNDKNLRVVMPTSSRNYVDMFDYLQKVHALMQEEKIETAIFFAYPEQMWRVRKIAQSLGIVEDTFTLALWPLRYHQKSSVFWVRNKFFLWLYELWETRYFVKRMSGI